MVSLSDNNQADVIGDFNFKIYLDDLFHIDIPSFEQMVSRTYPPPTKIQSVNKAN